MPQALFTRLRCVYAPRVYIVLQCYEAKINNTHVPMLFLCYGSNRRNFFFPIDQNLQNLYVLYESMYCHSVGGDLFFSMYLSLSLRAGLLRCESPIIFMRRMNISLQKMTRHQLLLCQEAVTQQFLGTGILYSSRLKV